MNIEQQEELIDIQPKAKKKIHKKRLPKLCTINCMWNTCESSVTLLPTEYETFSNHMKKHADEFVDTLQKEAETLNEHNDNEDKSLSYCCLWRNCSWEGCEDVLDLIRHIMLHGYHSLLKSIGEIERNKLNLTECNIEIDDEYHVLSTVNIPFHCDWLQCCEQFVCPNNYYRHVENHILEDLLDENGELQKPAQTKMTCRWKDCVSEFRDKHKLKEHMRVHTREKVMACPSCGGLFSNRTKLVDHLSRQNVEAYENYQCSHCLKRCASERLLRDHMRHHVNYLKCSLCDMTCPNPGSLKYHIAYRHSNERPYPCAMCEQSFKSNNDLIRHEESHLAKSYVCNMKGCKYTTKTAHCLSRHIRITHAEGGAKRYTCHICDQTYTRGFGLTKHLKKKHNFSWPSGHPRFRYVEYEDGLLRLQMVRFESAELTKRLCDEDDREEDGIYVEEQNEHNYTDSTKNSVNCEQSHILHEDAHITTELINRDPLEVYVDQITFPTVSSINNLNDIKIAFPSVSSINNSNDINLTTTNISPLLNILTQIEESHESSMEHFPCKQLVDYGEIPSALPVATSDIQYIVNANIATIGDIYLQPKPPGYNTDLMSQLVSLASKQTTENLNNESSSHLVSELYERLLKSSKKRQLDDNNTVDETLCSYSNNDMEPVYKKMKNETEEEFYYAVSSQSNEIDEKQIDASQALLSLKTTS